MRKIKNPWTDKEGYDCYGCCHDNPIGLHMDFYEDGDDIVCFWNPQQHFQGWVDTLHGGIQSTLIDEIASWVVFRKMSTTGVTSNLEVKFKKPVMTTENQITLRAHLVELRRNIATIEVLTAPYVRVARNATAQCELLRPQIAILSPFCTPLFSKRICNFSILRATSWYCNVAPL